MLIYSFLSVIIVYIALLFICNLIYFLSLVLLLCLQCTHTTNCITVTKLYKDKLKCYFKKNKQKNN